MLTEKQLMDLATAMSEKNGTGSTRRIDAGYTYFGQFISHEIVRATQHQGDPPPTRIATALLDLDSVYGTPEQMETWLPGGFFPTPALPALPGDLLRDPAGVAKIPEPRNDDNVIIAQLHRFWQRFHNFVLQKELADNPVQARDRVTKVVQLLVVEDYLRQVLAPSVFESYFRSNERWLTFAAPGIPPHFSHAGFRFGHSMVRGSYEFADGTDRNLEDLLRQHKLESKNLIDWQGFFGEPFDDNRVQDAMAIDPFVAFGMSGIPDDKAKTINIIKANLQAADSAGLPSGKAYVDELLAGPKGAELRSTFGLTPLTDLGVLAQHIPASSGITIDNLPLWPYVLLEAISTAEGRHLGVLGSLICAEVIASSIRQAPVSIYDGQWRTVDEVFATLGTLGTRLRAQRSANGGGPAPLRDFCMRHVIDLQAPRAQVGGGSKLEAKERVMSTVPIPELLKPWVAKPGQHTTGVTDPVVIDHTAIEDLAFYHPGFDNSTPHRFRHVADIDSVGPFARCDGAFSTNWHEKMQEVMMKLKLRPQVEFEHPCLIDTAIADETTRPMHGWRVVKWKVVKSRDLSMAVVHQDFITWKDVREGSGGRLVESMFTWRPYADEPPVPQELTTNERRLLREILRR